MFQRLSRIVFANNIVDLVFPSGKMVGAAITDEATTDEDVPVFAIDRIQPLPEKDSDDCTKDGELERQWMARLDEEITAAEEAAWMKRVGDDITKCEEKAFMKRIELEILVVEERERIQAQERPPCLLEVSYGESFDSIKPNKAIPQNASIQQEPTILESESSTIFTKLVPRRINGRMFMDHCDVDDLIGHDPALSFCSAKLDRVQGDPNSWNLTLCGFIDIDKCTELMEDWMKKMFFRFNVSMLTASGIDLHVKIDAGKPIGAKLVEFYEQIMLTPSEKDNCSIKEIQVALSRGGCLISTVDGRACNTMAEFIKRKLECNMQGRLLTISGKQPNPDVQATNEGESSGSSDETTIGESQVAGDKQCGPLDECFAQEHVDKEVLQSSDKYWEDSFATEVDNHFSIKFEAVATIEFRNSGINAQVALSSMWNQHKRRFGEDCYEHCECAFSTDFLTQHVVRDNRKHCPTWQNPLGLKAGENPVGFANCFCLKFQDLLRKQHPSESPHEILRRLCHMWKDHERTRVFGMECSDQCDCISGWESVFDKGLRTEEIVLLQCPELAKQLKTVRSHDAIGAVSDSGEDPRDRKELRQDGSDDDWNGGEYGHEDVRSEEALPSSQPEPQGHPACSLFLPRIGDGESKANEGANDTIGDYGQHPMSWQKTNTFKFLQKKPKSIMVRRESRSRQHRIERHVKFNAKDSLTETQLETEPVESLKVAFQSGSFLDALKIFESGLANKVTEHDLQTVRESINKAPDYRSRDLAMKDKILKIFMNACHTARHTKALKDWVEIKVSLVDFTFKDEDCNSFAGDGLVIELKQRCSEANGSSKEFVVSAIRYEDILLSPPFALRYNKQIDPHQMLVFVLRSASGTEYIGFKNISLQDILDKSITWGKSLKWKQPLSASSSLPENELTLQFDVSDCTEYKKKERRHLCVKLDMITNWIKLFNQEMTKYERETCSCSLEVPVMGMTLLQCAVMLAEYPLVQKLLGRGAKVNDTIVKIAEIDRGDGYSRKQIAKLLRGEGVAEGSGFPKCHEYGGRPLFFDDDQSVLEGMSGSAENSHDMELLGGEISRLGRDWLFRLEKSGIHKQRCGLFEHGAYCKYGQTCLFAHVHDDQTRPPSIFIPHRFKEDEVEIECREDQLYQTWHTTGYIDGNDFFILEVLVE